MKPSSPVRSSGRSSHRSTNLGPLYTILTTVAFTILLLAQNLWRTGITPKTAYNETAAVFSSSLIPFCPPNRLEQAGFPPLPEPNSKLPSKPADMPSYYEIIACRGLGVAYVHIYKSGGTVAATILKEFCVITTGEEAAIYTGVTGKSGPSPRIKDLNAICGKGGYMCYTFYRDPISRFLSGYHEVMRRVHIGEKHNGRLFKLSLDAEATDNEKMHSFVEFLKYREQAQFDPHVNTQASFLTKNGDTGRLATQGGVAFYDLDKMETFSQSLLCGALYSCVTSTRKEITGTVTSGDSHLFSFTKMAAAPFVCPYSSKPQGLWTRQRTDSDYGLKQYIVKEDDLDDETVTRIAALYKDDYCLFSIPEHARSQAKLRCS